jgi:hypothetical protein
MSSHPRTKTFGRLLRKIDEVWHAVAKLEETEHKPRPARARAELLEVSPAWILDIIPRADGTASVRINESHELVLPPKLVLFLQILAADTGRCADGAVAWKPANAVRAAIAEQTAGTPLSARALNQLAYRLRQELARHGVHPGLVQYNRIKRAFRFALRPARMPDTDETGINQEAY